ncbi:unnamed protein product [Coffea canephora]|uniref:Uncharacterized protein n=1 Tax=Coffea canephora TaxID=49390 RepID=A0A068V2Y8_COFCA|nr:unnamed protein product [Coffea canephora]
MVARAAAAAKKKQGQQKQEEHQQVQKQIILLNKGKTGKFKRSTSNLEEDGISSAMLLLACIACTPQKV